MRKSILYLIILISSVFLLKYMGVFSPKKVIIDEKISIITPQFYSLDLSILGFEKLDLSCYLNYNCSHEIILPNKSSVSSFSLVFKNVFDDLLSISVSKYIKDSKKTMIEGFGKIDLVKNECRVKQIKNDSSLCGNCIEYQILKDKYHIDLISNKKELLDAKLNEICI